MPTALLNEPVVNEAILEAAISGLSATPKTLTPWLFYDEAGSQLFEQITALPEYYLTRTERDIFVRHGVALPAQLATPVTIAELGAGSATKTGVLLQYFAAHQPDLLYQPLDISPTALDEAKSSLTTLIPGLEVQPQVANYITDRYTILRPAHHKVLALYIGSSIGNFSPTEAQGILENLRAHLAPGDHLLLGTDLAPGPQKSVATLLAAYDDAAGVTAAFNKNILTRLNRDLSANFALETFAHRARWNAAASRIEMHLESLIAQTVSIEGHPIHFTAGETIHTENSYKFTESSLATLLDASGFRITQIMRDADARFAVTLAEAV